MVRLIVLLSFALVWLPTAAPAHPLVAAARGQVGVTVLYDPAYVRLDYPGGDVPPDRGVCTDVVVRAFRVAWAVDLQKELHEDMKADFAAYPKKWGLSRPDKNIDHRRVPNLQTYFTRKGWKVAANDAPAAFRPGDIVTCTVPPHLPHVMVVSDRKTDDGARHLVIHNIGAGTREEDRLAAFEITGHYRPEPPSR